MTFVGWLYLLGSPPALFMPFYYHWTNRWWTSKEGRLFMLLMLQPFGLYVSTVLFLLVEKDFVRDILRIVLVILVALAGWSTLAVYTMIRREGLAELPRRRGRRPKQTASEE